MKLIQERKASTPRLDDLEMASAPASKQDLVKNCFGFDDEDDVNRDGRMGVSGLPGNVSGSPGNVTQESLPGFSPVKSVMSHIDLTPAKPFEVLTKKPKMYSTKTFRMDFKIPAR